jgi:hypothetical protein
MRINIYNLATKTWSAVGMPDISIWKEYLAVDLVGRVIYSIDGLKGELWRYNMDARTFTNLGPVPGGVIGMTNQIYVAWDSLNRVLLWHREGVATHVYHPDTQQWESLPQTASNVPGLNIKGRMIIYDPAQNAFVLYGGYVDDLNPDHYMYFLRYR